MIGNLSKNFYAETDNKKSATPVAGGKSPKKNLNMVVLNSESSGDESELKLSLTATSKAPSRTKICKKPVAKSKTKDASKL